MNYITIGICDGELSAAEQLKTMITSILEYQENASESIEYTIRIYESGEQLLEAAVFPDFVFLETDMPGMDGIETGRRICRQHPDSRIIMMTGRTERMKEAFRVRALRCVTKPFAADEVQEALRAALKSEIGKECILLYFNRSEYSVHQNEISMFHAYNSYIEAWARGKCMRKDISLNRMEKLLDARLFCRISKSHIVNLYYASGYDRQTRTVCVGGQKLVISRRNLKEFERRYIEYELNYL